MKKNAVKNIIRWIILITAIIIVYFWKKELIQSAFLEMKKLSALTITLCLALSVLYQILEGLVISRLSACTFLQGFRTAVYYAFYKLLTLGSGSGVAEIYSLYRYGVPAEKATGITLIQYALHKIMATALGIASFIFLILFGDRNILQYARFTAFASVISVIIALALILPATSVKISSLLEMIAKAVLKNRPQKLAAVQEKLRNLTQSGKDVFVDKKNLSLVLATDAVKLLCWFSIPPVIFCFSVPNLAAQDFFLMAATFAVAFMLAGVMVSPSGAGTLEYVFSLFFAARFSALSATAIILFRFFTMIVPFIMGIPAVLAKGPAKPATAPEADAQEEI